MDEATGAALETIQRHSLGYGVECQTGLEGASGTVKNDGAPEIVFVSDWCRCI